MNKKNLQTIIAAIAGVSVPLVAFNLVGYGIAHVELDYLKDTRGASRAHRMAYEISREYPKLNFFTKIYTYGAKLACDNYLKNEQKQILEDKVNE